MMNRSNHTPTSIIAVAFLAACGSDTRSSAPRASSLESKESRDDIPVIVHDDAHTAPVLEDVGAVMPALDAGFAWNDGGMVDSGRLLQADATASAPPDAGADICANLRQYAGTYRKDSAARHLFTLTAEVRNGVCGLIPNGAEPPTRGMFYVPTNANGDIPVMWTDGVEEEVRFEREPTLGRCLQYVFTSLRYWNAATMLYVIRREAGTPQIVCPMPP